MSLAISCCQHPYRSAISVSTLILLVSVGFVQFSRFFAASFDGAKDTAYTAKYGHPPEMKQGRGKGRGGKGREKGTGGWAASWQGGEKGKGGRKRLCEI